MNRKNQTTGIPRTCTIIIIIMILAFGAFNVFLAYIYYNQSSYIYFSKLKQDIYNTQPPQPSQPIQTTKPSQPTRQYPEPQPVRRNTVVPRPKILFNTERRPMDRPLVKSRKVVSSDVEIKSKRNKIL